MTLASSREFLAGTGKSFGAARCPTNPKTTITNPLIDFITYRRVEKCGKIRISHSVNFASYD